MRACGAPQRGPRRQGRGARGRWLGQPAGDRDADGLRAAAQVEHRLGPLRRGGARARRPAAVPAPRQGDRRFGVDQRDDLRPRQPRRLRRVGRRRRRGLELRRGAAVLQALGGQRARRGRVPRRGWAVERVRQPRHEPADRDDDRGDPARGLRGQPRLQRRPPGRRRTLPAHAAKRAPLLDRRRLPASGEGAAEPGRAHRRDGAADPVRRLPRRRRRGRPRRHRSRRSAPSAR